MVFWICGVSGLLIDSSGDCERTDESRHRTGSRVVPVAKSLNVDASGDPSTAFWICDVNGVLIDSIALVREAFLATAMHFGFAVPEDCLRRTNGHPLAGAYRIMDPCGDSSARVKFHLGYVRERLATVHAFSGVSDTLAMAKRAGVKVAAVTSHGEFAEGCLVHTGLYAFIDCLVTQEEVKRPKPDPESIVLALALLRADCTTSQPGAVCVGDTSFDIRAGRAAGIHTVGVTYGASAEAVIRAAQPDYVIHRFDAMSAFVRIGRSAAFHRTAHTSADTESTRCRSWRSTRSDSRDGRPGVQAGHALDYVAGQDAGRRMT
jgi:phosphoglycolate phosphatase-like HAD superfamily hydrolase